MFGRMTDVYPYAQAGQSLRNRALHLIRTRNFKAKVVQYFGNAAHTHAAYADKMDVFNSVLHESSLTGCR